METAIISEIETLINSSTVGPDWYIGETEYLPEYQGSPALRIYGKDGISHILRVTEE